MFDILTRYRKSVADYRSRRETIRQLQALDDRMLKDIGLTRLDIEPVALFADIHRR